MRDESRRGFARGMRSPPRCARESPLSHEGTRVRPAGGLRDRTSMNILLTYPALRDKNTTVGG